MSDLRSIPLFPNAGIRLIAEDTLVAAWEEIFEPGVATPPHRHTRDYIAVFPDGGEPTFGLTGGR